MVVWIKDDLGVAPCSTRVNSHVSRLDVRDLVDGKGNDLGLLRNKIQTGAKMLRNGKKLVVCCDMGISRSVAISIGILTLLDKSFDSSVKLVGSKIKDQSVNLDILEDVRKCLNPTNNKQPRKREKSRILIAGSTESIGRSVIGKLSGRYSFFNFDENKTDLSKETLSPYREIKKNRIDLIMDLTHHSPSNSIQSFARSVATTRNILEACRVSDTPLIHLSSLSVFDGYYEDSVLPLESSIERKPASISGQGAGLCEELIQWYRDVHALNATILRPANVYGRNMDKKGFLWKFIIKASEDKPITVHKYLNGFQRFDFLHIDDLIHALGAAIQLSPSEDINLGTGVGISTFDVAELIMKSTASKSKIDIRDVDNYAPNLIPDIKKAKEKLSWRPKTSLTQGLKDLLKT